MTTSKSEKSKYYISEANLEKINSYQRNIIERLFKEKFDLSKCINQEWDKEKHNDNGDIKINFKIGYLNIHCFFCKNDPKYTNYPFKLKDIKINLYRDYFMLWANEENELWNSSDRLKDFEKTLKSKLKIDDPIKDLAYIFYINVFHNYIDKENDLNGDMLIDISDSMKLISYINETYIKTSKYFKENITNEGKYLIMGTSLEYNNKPVFCIFKNNNLLQIRTLDECIAGSDNDSYLKNCFPFLKKDELPHELSVYDYFTDKVFSNNGISNGLMFNRLTVDIHKSTHSMNRFIERFNSIESLKKFFDINSVDNDNNLKDIIKLIICADIRLKFNREKIKIENNEQFLYIDQCTCTPFPEIKTSFLKEMKLPEYFKGEEEYYYLVISAQSIASDGKEINVNISTIYDKKYRDIAIKKFYHNNNS